MSKQETSINDQYASTLSCEAAIETTTGGSRQSMRTIYLVPTERTITTKKASDIAILQENVVHETDFIVASQSAYAALAPNERHELDIWDVTLNDGLDEY